MAVRSWQMEFWMIWWFNNIPFNLRSCEKLIHENSQRPKVHCSIMALEPKIEIMICMWVFRWKCNYVTLYLSSQPHPLPLPRLPWVISWKAKAWGSDLKCLCWSKCPYITRNCRCFTLFRMISGATYSGVPQNVHVLLPFWNQSC